MKRSVPAEYLSNSVQAVLEGKEAYDLLRAGKQPIILTGQKYTNRNFSYWDFSNVDLTGCEFTDCICEETNFDGAILNNASFKSTEMRKARFYKARMKNTNFEKSSAEEAIFTDAKLGPNNFESTNFFGAHFNDVKKLPHDSCGQDVVFNDCTLIQTNFRKAKLQGAVFHSKVMQRVDFSQAFLKKTNFKKCHIEHGIFDKAKVMGACFDQARLISTTFKSSDLSFTSFRNAVLTSANLKFADFYCSNFDNTWLDHVRYSFLSRYTGISIPKIRGGQLFRQFALDQAYIEELRGISGYKRFWGRMVAIPSFKELCSFRLWFRYMPWFLSSICGRSFLVFLFWVLIITLGFAFIYDQILPIDVSIGFTNVDPNKWKIQIPGIALFSQYLDFRFCQMLYFSIVTFTTLGFGDITPKTNEAAFWVCTEVIIGFLMLGILLSLFSMKFFRKNS